MERLGSAFFTRLTRSPGRGKLARMAQKRWSLSVPLDGFTLAEHAEIARDAERWGYTDAWSFEVDGVDCFSPLAVVGMGAGSQPIVETWNGGKFDRPATRVREMVRFLRSALAGERVVFQGETFSVDGFRLARPPAHPIPIHVAALRPGMLRLAGEAADGAVLNWLSPDDVPKSVSVVREAAQKAGRDPDAIEITARLMINVDPPTPESDLVVRRHITGYLNVPVYRAFHEWLGRGDALAPMWEAWSRGDRKAAVAAIPEGVVHDLIIRGSTAASRAVGASESGRARACSRDEPVARRGHGTLGRPHPPRGRIAAGEEDGGATPAAILAVDLARSRRGSTRAGGKSCRTGVA